MSAAGYGSYAALDMDAKQALAFASQAAPGILDEFLVETTQDDSSVVSA